MKVAKQAVGYYCQITGNKWSDFFSKVDEALAHPAPTGELWLIANLMKTINSHGMSLAEFKMNKDAIKAEFDEEGRKLAGEFFTPFVWAEEGHKYIEKYIPNWKEHFNLWEGSCYTMDTEILVKGDTENIEDGRWVKYTNLDDSDEVLGYNKETDDVEWVNFHYRFTKPYSGFLYYFTAIDDDNNALHVNVTEDHKMVYLKDGQYCENTAEVLYRELRENYLRGKFTNSTFALFGRDKNGKPVECKLSFAHSYRTPVEMDVWDITMDSLHVFLTRVEGTSGVFSSNCGSGNLVKTANFPKERLFMSTLQQDDVDMLQSTPEFNGANIFQCDFLTGIDVNEYTTEFLDKLPPRLKEIIKNDEPLIIYMNPPYKVGSAKATDIGLEMIDNKLGMAAYDIFYQFCYRVMRFVEIFHLSNCYYCFFGPLTFFTGAGANVLLKRFEHSFEFLDGMCISAQEFSDTSDSILWGIGCSIWKSRGGYCDDFGVDYHKDILLDKKFLLPDGSVGCEGKVLYEPPRMKLSDWVAPRNMSVDGFEEAPLMTSHLTFKGSDVEVKVAPKRGKLAKNALGTLMIGNTLTRSSDQSAVLSMPSTIQFTNIVEENFWRCVASYTFRRVYDASWAVAKKEISAPNTNVEGYDIWLRNALVAFLFEYKSMMSSIRDVQFDGELYNVRNKLFFLSEEEVRANCSDPVILADLDKNPPQNQFMLQMIKESEPYWVPEVRQLYDWCKAYTLWSYNQRCKVNYKGSLDCWDAGFQQLRAGLWSEQLQDDCSKYLAQARDWLRKDIDKFGFVTETESDQI